MFLHVDTTNGIPIYVQIVKQIKNCIAGGILLPGDKLPSVRELATQLTINPNTIQKAYQELEQQGVIQTLRGKGTFVSEGVLGISDEKRRQKIEEMIRALLVEAYHLNFTREEIMAELTKALNEWQLLKGGGEDA